MKKENTNTKTKAEVNTKAKTNKVNTEAKVKTKTKTVATSSARVNTGASTTRPHTNSLDKRCLKTRNALCSTLLAEYETGFNLANLTITKLCHDSHISTATFYQHFGDIHNISEHYNQELNEELRELFSRGDLTIILFKLFLFVHRHQDYFKATLKQHDYSVLESIGEYVGLTLMRKHQESKYDRPQTQPQIQLQTQTQPQTPRQGFNNNPSQSISLHLRIASSVAIETLKYWIQQEDCDMDKDKIAKYMRAIQTELIRLGEW